MKNFLIVAVVVLTSGFLSCTAEPERLVRQVDPKPGPKPKPSVAELKKYWNVADEVSEDYPAIFNIILFIAVSLILALIAICVTIATMDPGRDSLIYRVTSAQRYKKDN